MVWIGFDPGGIGAFGVAIMREDHSAECHTVSCADEAFELLDVCPMAIGVDAPLWWSSGRTGIRRCDRWIRKKYDIPSGTVQAANSLRGAALVQGAMIVAKIRAEYSNVRVTEAHPKALLRAMGCGHWNEIPLGYDLRASPDTDHEKDAIVAAIAAREGTEGRWANDLSVSRHQSEQDPSRYWLAPVHYD